MLPPKCQQGSEMTAITHETLRRAIADTRYRESGCISTAAYFLKDLARAVGKLEAAQWFGHKTWRKALSVASKTLVLHNPQTEFDLEVKAVKDDGVQLPDGCIAEVTSRVTTVDKDWDGDIVHPDGLIFDPRGAFLWMHSQAQPIGKLAQVLTQDEQQARCKFYLADVPLGRDALTLFRLGALRKSIGFKVLEATPIGFVSGQNGKEVPTGFDIKRAAVLETSAVAIPANPNTEVERVLAKEYDAVRSLGVKGFESHLMQKFVGTILDGRQKVFRGARPDGTTELADFAKEVAEQVTKSLKSQEGTMTKTTELDTKEVDSELVAKMMSYGMDDYAEGSYEEAQDGVYKGCQKYLCDKGQCSSEHRPMLLATYGDKALVAMRKYDYESGSYDRKCYELGYKMDGSKCTITSHKAVKLTPAVMEVAEKKFDADLKTKAADLKPVGNNTGDAEADLLEEAGCGGGMKKQTEVTLSDEQLLRGLLVKMLTGQMETSGELLAMLSQAASHFEKAAQVDELLGLVGAGA